MLRTICCSAAVLVLGLVRCQASEIHGDYVESRTCDVYTGPCFANSEVGLTGRNAILAWSIESGQHQGVDLAGLKVVVALRAANTLAYGGGMAIDPLPERSVILVDHRANTTQRKALADFARRHAGKLVGQVARIDAVEIDMQCDHVDMIARLSAGKEVALQTRKLSDSDHCCTNEEIFYPPLTTVENAQAAVTVDGGFEGRGLGVRWQNPQTRSAFLATFAY